MCVCVCVCVCVCMVCVCVCVCMYGVHVVYAWCGLLYLCGLYGI